MAPTAANRPSSRAAPAMSFHEISPARYHVKILGATAPFVVALSDSWSADWRITGAPAGTLIDHLRIDGYRNGWAVDARDDPGFVDRVRPGASGAARDSRLARRRRCCCLDDRVLTTRSRAAKEPVCVELRVRSDMSHPDYCARFVCSLRSIG